MSERVTIINRLYENVVAVSGPTVSKRRAPQVIAWTVVPRCEVSVVWCHCDARDGVERPDRTTRNRQQRELDARRWSALVPWEQAIARKMRITNDLLAQIRRWM